MDRDGDRHGHPDHHFTEQSDARREAEPVVGHAEEQRRGQGDADDGPTGQDTDHGPGPHRQPTQVGNLHRSGASATRADRRCRSVGPGR